MATRTRKRKPADAATFQAMYDRWVAGKDTERIKDETFDWEVPLDFVAPWQAASEEAACALADEIVARGGMVILGTLLLMVVDLHKEDRDEFSEDHWIILVRDLAAA